ncbi:hypothetical protein P4637_10225 [Halalkalibacterium halodurans]|jgi:uncharacterized membrane protein|uniref:BH2869 protein n=1 Tax=Halalkalibacterium halodurans (strain ATCC BAA-125 / DSM 18197 / FERM 7344 / JCM 9153 / C-125) TaxID=272558 RepID=Q9K8Y3_HALH5|nr:hypothetical protein [Halalkalibacterium halodurans]MDY7223421.1 hypothetical protein [Halalkalibacterium halodurans]MDY7242642.1 hypothetical protein [Halalkalibacterium halodurans]MED3647333.1 hypothetical protein [Halalkalibacterium halodurans]MED4081651.1 hypothetical protein [Halalkalibacterium halodurans]MED4085204.1 hypothetical protein [Halalkalibacterium halodurans]
MTKLQMYQLVAVLLLVGFVIYSYTTDVRYHIPFFILVALNLVLWVLRLKERYSKKHTDA